MNKKELLKHGIDCLLAFAISFLSILGATGTITWKDVGVAIIPSLLVGIIKFRDVWNTHLNPKCPTPTILY